MFIPRHNRGILESGCPSIHLSVCPFILALLSWPMFTFWLQITHPAGCFAQFINFFGEHVFTLWKFALLQRRIIFFSPPPIGVVCYRGEGKCLCVCVCADVCDVFVMCMCVCLRECVCACMCVFERERVCVCLCGYTSVFVWLYCIVLIGAFISICSNQVKAPHTVCVWLSLCVWVTGRVCVLCMILSTVNRLTQIYKLHLHQSPFSFGTIHNQSKHTVTHGEPFLSILIFTFWAIVLAVFFLTIFILTIFFLIIFSEHWCHCHHCMCCVTLPVSLQCTVRAA